MPAPAPARPAPALSVRLRRAYAGSTNPLHLHPGRVRVRADAHVEPVGADLLRRAQDERPRPRRPGAAREAPLDPLRVGGDADVEALPRPDRDERPAELDVADRERAEPLPGGDVAGGVLCREPEHVRALRKWPTARQLPVPAQRVGLAG